jgi:voltage-gated potassium channel
MSSTAKEHTSRPIRPHEAIAEFSRILWHLRSIFAVMLTLFLFLGVAMYYLGGPVQAATRMQASFGEVIYFCSVTALTIGYGDIVPTTVLGRITAVLLGLLGVLMTGLVTAAAVYAIQVAAQRAGILPR